MEIKYRACGDYATNCYIAIFDWGELIVDPGVRATSFIKDVCKNPKAILNTHGHFDHVWSNKELQDIYNLPIYIKKEDAFMLEGDVFGLNMPSSKPTNLIEKESVVSIEGVDVKFMHFPGHTPGCCMIEIEETIFSGDFIFHNSIGRSDFPYSSIKDMRESLERFLELKENKILYPGHGAATDIFSEQKNIPYWLSHMVD